MDSRQFDFEEDIPYYSLIPQHCFILMSQNATSRLLFIQLTCLLLYCKLGNQYFRISSGVFLIIMRESYFIPGGRLAVFFYQFF